MRMRALADALRRVYAPLVALLLLGTALRVYLSLAYEPAILTNPDTGRFLHFAHGEGPGLFGDAFGPTGYSAFLSVARELSSHVTVTIALQHAFGIATAVLLYATTRRLGAPRAVALVPAAWILLSGDQLYVEHALLTEWLFIFLVAAGLFAAVRGLDPPRAYLWLAAAGGLVASAALVRAVGLPLLPVVVVWIALALPVERRRKLLGVGAATASAAAILGGYALITEAQDGATGLGELSGWNAYGRAAPFADCDEFDPPKGTRVLCEERPPSERPGTLWYLWLDGSPAREALGHPPNGDDTVGRFGRAAILHQPLDYIELVARDAARFVDPEIGAGPWTGAGRFRTFRERDPETERSVGRIVDLHYRAPPLEVSGLRVLDRWQKLERGGGVVPAAMIALTLAGLVAARGRVRAGVALFGAVAAALVLFPAATLLYLDRYGVPPRALLPVSAALGGWALAVRLRPWVEARRR